MVSFSSPDVMRFMDKKVSRTGKALGPSYEIVSDVKTRAEGVRIKHRLGMASDPMEQFHNLSCAHLNSMQIAQRGALVIHEPVVAAVPGFARDLFFPRDTNRARFVVGTSKARYDSASPRDTSTPGVTGCQSTRQ